MRVSIRHAILALGGLCSGALALGQLHVENAAVGQRTLVITFDDSIRSPDLSKIRVEGYDIENAVFVEEMGPEPTRFAPEYLDLTLPGTGRSIDFAPGSGTLILELPDGKAPVPGIVVADTAFGGYLRKVVEVNGRPQSGTFGRRWVLRTVEADLPEAVQDCDIAFKTRMDLNQALADVNLSEDVAGTSSEGLPAYGRMGIGMTSAQVLFQPTVTGRIRVRNGQVELFRFQVAGDCEVMGSLRASVLGAGEFDYEEELAGKPPMLVPLGSGLFLRMRNRPFLHVGARNYGDSFYARADLRVLNSIKGELGFGNGQWRPMAENRMTWEDKSLQDLRGKGEVRMSIKPRVEMLLQGVQGPVFTFEPYARFASAPAELPTSGWGPGTPPASASASLSGSPAAEGLSGSAPGWRAGAFHSGTAAGASGAAGKAWIANRELSVGADIHMETRTNFTGPPELRDFLLFSREQIILSPPREGTLSLKEADSNRIALQCQTYPKSDYYIIQQKLGAGPWETVQEHAVLPRIRTSLLKPNSLYHFRALGVNAQGIGQAFPPEGVAYLTPMPNRPPFPPLARFPDSAAILPGSAPVALAWAGGDPDAGSEVRYTVYLDTRFPPLSIRANGIGDTGLVLGDLKAGETYFWKVVASDGMERSEGPVRTFTIRRPAPVAPRIPKASPGPYPLVFVPKGSFRREDGREIQVGPFFIGKYEVTQQDYEKIIGRNPSYRLNDSLPVDRVTWEEAETFCNESGGRLPTEAEWEYAARAGSASSYYWGAGNPGDYAWYRDNSDNRTRKVGLKKPNAWGLYDMAGNVFEWVGDWYADYGSQVDNPKGPEEGTAKVIRGASWYSESGSLSLSARYNNRPGFRNFKVGFRCAKDPDRAAYLEDAASLTGQSAGLASRPGNPPAK